MTAARRNKLTELVWRMHRRLYQLSGGRIGARVGELPVLLLTARGRKTGEARTVALNYLLDRGAYVVFASHAGEDREPPWWLNLRAAGVADVQVGSRRFRVRATEVEGDERTALYERVKDADPGYGEYERRTPRRIAVVRLEPSA